MYCFDSVKAPRDEITWNFRSTLFSNLSISGVLHTVYYSTGAFVVTYFYDCKHSHYTSLIGCNYRPLSRKYISVCTSSYIIFLTSIQPEKSTLMLPCSGSCFCVFSVLIWACAFWALHLDKRSLAELFFTRLSSRKSVRITWNESWLISCPSIFNS